MGIETLQNAAKAAGFAMAVDDEPETKQAATAEHVPTVPMLIAAPERKIEPQGSLGDWVKSLLPLTGRATA